MAKNPAFLQKMDTSSISNLVQSMTAVINAASFTTNDKNTLLALVQNKQGDEDDLGAPAAATYKSHSSGIIDVLEDLKEKAESELAEARKAESSTKHNFAMMKQSLEDQMGADTKDMTEEKADKASAEGDLAVTIKALETSEKGLATANSNCMTT